MNKKFLIFGALGFLALFIIGFAAAVLIDFYSNTLTDETDLDSPITLDGAIGLDIDIQYSGDDDFALVKITNHAKRDIVGDVKFSIGPDVVGVGTAITEDINYCFSSQGDMTGVTDCETDYMTWMGNNIDWNDWYASESYSDAVFFSDLVINHGGDSFHSLGYTGNTLILPGLNFPTGETVYGVIYIVTDPALEPTTYDFDLVVTPISS